jgi:transposase
MENTLKTTDKFVEIEEKNRLLKQQIYELNNKVVELNSINTELDLKVKWYEEQYRLSQQKRFGSSSESTHLYEQINIFNEAEATLKDKEPELEEITYKRRKPKEKREDKFKNLHVEVIEYKLSEEELECKICGNNLHEMSTVVRKEIEIIPAQLKIVEHKSFVYSCRNCEKNNITTPIIKAKMPSPVIPGSIASASSIAYVMEQKYVQGLPLYRQEQQFKRLDIDLSRQTMSNWIIQTSERWLSYLYERMHMLLLEKNILHADETSLQVPKEPDRPAETKSYMWLYRTGRDGPHIVLYDYQTTRAGKHPKNFLKGYTGYLNVDGYPGYNNLPGIILIGCISHARRKFTDALKALPKGTDTKGLAAKEGLDFCNKLFAIERDLKDATPEERYKKRIEKSKPVLDDFLKWLKYQKPRALPKSSFGIAINYCLNQWDKLCGFLKDGRLEIHNNRAERSMKSFVVGRKGWLFSNTPKGAKSSSIIYSIVETAKENDLKPFEYLKYILKKMPNINIEETSEFDKLLPWSDELPENCRIK